MTEIDRLPPSNLEAEEAVLGSILIDPDCLVDLGFLKPADFYRGTNGWILETLRTLEEKRVPLDFVTVCDDLRSRERLEEIGGEAYIINLLNAVPTSINAVAYGRIVQKTAVFRKLINAAGQVANLGYSDGDLDDVLSTAQSIIGDLADYSTNNAITHIRTMMEQVLDHVERVKEFSFSGIPTGYTDLDAILGGQQGGDFIVIGARPGMGKTALMNGIRMGAAKAGYKVGSFDMEMSELQNAIRMLSSESRVPARSIRDGNITDLDTPRIMEAAGELSLLNIYVDASPRQTIDSIVSRARLMYFRSGIDLILVDYAQLIEVHGRSRQEEVTRISQKLKGLARELNIPVIAAAQLSRSVEQRQDKRPMLSDLRESGSLEQDADIVMFIYRDEYYNPDTTERPNIAEISIAKHRNGPTGVVDLYWHSKLATFRNLQRKQIDLGEPSPWENKAAMNAPED